MKYKLVVLDIDGTLLRSDGEISEKTKSTIKSLVSKGVRFALATGRNDILALPYVRDLGIEAIVIGCNGASIRNIDTNEHCSVTKIDDGACLEILKKAKEFGLRASACSMTKWFLTQEDAAVLHRFADNTYTASMADMLKDGQIITDNVESCIDGVNEIIKIVISSAPTEKIIEFQNIINKIELVEAVRPLPDMIDVGAKGVSKGTGVTALAKALSIPMEQVVVFGDGENDLSMFKVAGLGVAMENAQEVLKQNATFITDSNDNDGVAKALERIFISGEISV